MCLILSPGSQSEGSILLSGRGCGRISLVSSEMVLAVMHNLPSIEKGHDLSEMQNIKKKI